MPPSARLAEAEALMGERRFAEAIAAFERHLADEPQDLRALLKLGICHLLNRSRGAFLDVHRRAEQAIARVGALPSEVAELYELYRSLVVRVGAATLVAGTLVFSPGCTESGSGGDAASVGEATDAGLTRPRPQHRYSGGVRLNRPAPDFGEADAPVAPPPPPAEQKAAPQKVRIEPDGDANRARLRYGVGLRMKRNPADER